MCDSVLLQDLIKTSARGQTIGPDVLFRHFNFDIPSECVHARATSPCSAEAVARALRFLGIRTATACARSAPDLGELTRRFSTCLLPWLQIEVNPETFAPFRREMGNVYNLFISLTDS